jgi:CheY-like chemotaxis protein
MINTKDYFILVAEDIEFNYLLIKAMIGKKYNLIRAKTGVETVNEFDKQHVDLILMDMKMPEMDGITATKIIRSKDLNIPIIAVTAYAFNSDKVVAMEAGCNDYLVKPIDVKALEETIEKYLPSK